MAKVDEQLYTVDEVAEKLKISHMSVRRYFQDAPGVLKMGPRGRRNKRDHTTLRIPESVLVRKLEEWKN